MTDKIDIQEIPSLKNIGEVLKKKREELSYTLEHASEVTCITHTNLRNLEEGNLDDLPGPVFVKGFIKNYARFLNIECGWMIEALDDDQSFSGQVSSDYAVVGQSGVLRSHNKFHYKYVTGIISLALILGGLFWWNDKIFNYFFSGKEPLETINALETAENDKHAVINDAQTENDSRKDDVRSDDIQSPSVDTTDKQNADNQVASPLNLVLAANENQWIRLSVDNKPPFDLLLNKGERYSWPAQEEYFLIMSSGGGASIRLNGEEITDGKKLAGRLYQAKLNKFTLDRINNR